MIIPSSSHYHPIIINILIGHHDFDGFDGPSQTFPRAWDLMPVARTAKPHHQNWARAQIKRGVQRANSEDTLWLCQKIAENDLKWP